MIHICVINKSSLDDKEVSAVVPAMQTQITEHFAPTWGYGANLHFVGKSDRVPANMWWMGIFDTTDEPGALGYHDLTNAGLPLGKVFQATDKKYGENWTVTLSHELLEMLGDPNVNLTVFEQGSRGGVLYSYENCDPVEADEYKIDGVSVSNFVFPCYWERFRQKGTKFDHMGLIHTPLELRPGGYCSYFDISGGSWKQKNHQSSVKCRKLRPHIGSRRSLRTVSLDDRMYSSVDGVI